MSVKKTVPDTDGSGAEHREALRLLRPPSLPQKGPVNWAQRVTDFALAAFALWELVRFMISSEHNII